MGAAVNIGRYAISHVALNAVATRAKAGEAVQSLVERVWDKIVDFFCGTCRDEAKRNLSVLYSPRKTDNEKIESFFRLRELADVGYRDQFEIHERGGEKIYSMRVDWHPEYQWSLRQVDRVFNNQQIIKEYVMKKLNESRRRDVGKNIDIVNIDLPRGTYIVNHTQIKIHGDGGDQSVYCHDQLKALLKEMQCSNEEVQSAYAMLGQQLFATLLTACVVNESGQIDMRRYQHCLGASKVRYELARGEGGRLECSASLNKDISFEHDDATFKMLCDDIQYSAEYLKSMNINFRAFTVKDGEIIVSRFEVWANDASPVASFV